MYDQDKTIEVITSGLKNEKTRRQIARRLNGIGLTTKRGKKWTDVNVHNFERSVMKTTTDKATVTTDLVPELSGKPETGFETLTTTTTKCDTKTYDEVLSLAELVIASSVEAQVKFNLLKALTR